MLYSGWKFLSDGAVQNEIDKMTLLDRYARILWLDSRLDYLLGPCKRFADFNDERDLSSVVDIKIVAKCAHNFTPWIFIPADDGHGPYLNQTASEMGALREVMQHPFRIERRRIAFTCFQDCMKIPHHEMTIILHDARELAHGILYNAFYGAGHEQQWTKSAIVLQQEQEARQKGIQKKDILVEIPAETEKNGNKNNASAAQVSRVASSCSSSFAL